MFKMTRAVDLWANPKSVLEPENYEKTTPKLWITQMKENVTQCEIPPSFVTHEGI